jgi:SAM-dependent methyltransferase
MTGIGDQRTVRALADLATPMSVRAAATLRLAELADSWTTAAELAAATATVAEMLRELLDHLVTVGLFEVHGGRYRTTALGRQLRDDAPDGLRAELDAARWTGRANLAFVELLHSLSTGELAYQRRYGQSFWDDLAAIPALRASFDAAMSTRLAYQAAQIARVFSWNRYTEIVDVGGGDGTLLIAILRTNPHLCGRVLDLPPAATAAAARIAESGMTDRASAVTGSFFDPLPGGADAYLLSDVVHDWDDEKAAKIIGGCARAARPGGSVIVIEELRGANTARDLGLAIILGGRERTADQLTALAAGCELSLRGLTQVSDRRTAIEFVVI